MNRLTAPRADRRRRCLWRLYPFGKALALVASQHHHIEELVGRIGRVGKRQRRPGEWNVEHIHGDQIALPRLAVYINLDVEQLDLLQNLLERATSSPDITSTVGLLVFGAALDQRRNEANAKTLDQQFLFAAVLSDVHQMELLDVPDAPLFGELRRRAGNAERTRDVIGAAERHDADRSRAVGKMAEYITHGAVATCGHYQIVVLLQRVLDVVRLGGDIDDLVIGKLQGIDDAVLVVSFGPGGGIVHEERPHRAITASVRNVFPVPRMSLPGGPRAGRPMFLRSLAFIRPCNPTTPAPCAPRSLAARAPGGNRVAGTS